MSMKIVAACALTLLCAGNVRAQTVREWFRMSPCGAGVSLQPGPRNPVVVDQPNGYIRVGHPYGEAGEVTFVVFRRADGSRLFACHTAEPGDGAAIYTLTFYNLVGGRMEEVQTRLVPELSLEDFLALGTALPPRYRITNLRYVLPRVGTTIRVELDFVDPIALSMHAQDVEPGHAFSAADEERYDRIVSTSRYRAIELNWDRTPGVFSIGRKITR